MIAEWGTKEEVRWWCLRPLVAAPTIFSSFSSVTDPFFDWAHWCLAERGQCSEVWPCDQVLAKEVLNGTSEMDLKERVTSSPLAPHHNSISHYGPWSDFRDGSPEWQRRIMGFWVWKQSPFWPYTAHLCSSFSWVRWDKIHFYYSHCYFGFFSLYSNMKSFRWYPFTFIYIQWIWSIHKNLYW